MEIKVQLPSGPGLYANQTLVITEVSIFSDWSVGMSLHIDSYTAQLEGPGTEIDYDSLSKTESDLIDKAIWDEYYKIEGERRDVYGYNPAFEDE